MQTYPITIDTEPKLLFLHYMIHFDNTIILKSQTVKHKIAS